MLTKTEQDNIIDLVRQKPRTVQEIAISIQKNWRTADRYVERIAQETGLLATRIFREGSRGALKIVYWNALDRAKGSAYQERLLQKILQGRKKEDFSPFDIYQFVQPDKREAYIETTEFSTKTPIKYDKVLAQANKQVLFFSGNLSWVELGPNMQKTLLLLAKQKTSIKVLTKVDVTSQKNTEKMLQINQQCGWNAVEIRHCEHPLRAIIIDDTRAVIKEVLNPQNYRNTELKNKTFVFYKITDTEWVNWLQKVFWHLWGTSIDAQTRIKSLNSLNT
ncbi:MAG: hypothetical protein HY363_03495 [Candidatus Aenigmarchaeota archaeon]|nr:hypothetical protein [Candidatus Aenigmarchaeota archaeon]